MERLTKRTADGKVAYAPLQAGECVDTIDLLRVWGGRLAAYEDTGLEPEVCAEYKEFEDEAIGNGVTFKRIVELMQAEKDGRLVVLPCKVGDTVYIIRDKKIIIATVETIHQWSSGKWKLNVHTDKRYIHWFGYEVFFDDFGKTAFLTHEEAEAALKMREEEDDEAD